MKAMLKVTMLTLLISACSTDNKIPDPPVKPPAQPTQPAHGNVTIKFEKVGDLPNIAEKSGVCQGTDKRLYIIQDSDQPSDVTVTDVKGKKLGTIKLKVTNNDFEAVACSEGLIYVGDIGDGASSPTIYRFPQPVDANATVTPMKLPFTYSDNNENAEGLAVRGGRVYVVSKVEDGAQKVYEIVNGKASPILTLPIKEEISDMSISPDGSKILFAQDESDTFHECDWSGVCKAIKTPFSGDHEAVSYLENGDWVFMSEDESELYRASYVSDTDVVIPGKPEQPTKPPTQGYWEPGPIKSFQIFHFDGLSDFKKKLQKVDVIVAELEQLEEAGKASVDHAHAQGTMVICYTSEGFENFRTDAASYPRDARGNAMQDWDGEAWGDPRKPSLVAFIGKRMDRCKRIGGDGIELDNADQHGNVEESGIKITLAENIVAQSKLAEVAHSKGLAIFYKNGGDAADALSKTHQGVLIEQCNQYRECESYKHFTGKPVMMVEYSKSCPSYSWAVCQKKSGYFK